MLAIKPFTNGDRKVDSNISKITVEFSTEMDKNYRNFELGPLREKALMKIKRVVGFSGDGKSISFEIEPLQPDQRYQLEIGGGFRDKAGLSLKPYLIDFTTAAR